MHDIALAVLASGGHGQKKIIYGVLLLIVIVLVIGWVMAAKKARNRS
jgi:cytochrome b subunit of formate dehydrogenase